MLSSRSAARQVLAVLGGVLLGVFAGCSTSDCRSMKGSGSVLGDLVCGGQGSSAPEPDAPPANACSDVRLVMPGFFKLLDDPSKPLDGLRQAVKALGAPICPAPPRACTEGDTCPVGDCGADGFCPCEHPTSPLADLLVITFKGLNAIAADKVEPGAAPGARCVSTVLAAQLAPGQINRMCEVRRMLDVLLQQNGGQTLLNDPNVQTVVVSLLQYLQGKPPTSLDGVPHYDLFTTLGRMAQNEGICSPRDAYDTIDKVLLYYTPSKAAADLGALQALLADPTTKDLLKGLSTGGSAQGRASIITLAHTLITSLTGASNGAAATASIDRLLSDVVYPYIDNHYPASFKAKVKAAVAAIEAPLADATGIFPPLQSLLRCVNDPIIDHNGELIGALYDLISLQLPDGKPGVDLATLIGAVRTLVTLDQTGQVARSLRLIIEGARNDDAATLAVRKLLAQALTPEIGKLLLPPLDALVQHQVLGEVLTLLDDLLYSCKPPAGQR